MLSKVLHLNYTPDDNDVVLRGFSIKGLEWPSTGVDKAPSQNDKYFLDNLPKHIGELTCQYDKTVFVGAFN